MGKKKSIAANGRTVERVVLTEAEFCRMVGISRTKCWRLRKKGRLPYLQMEGRIGFLQEHADEYLASCEIPAKGRSKISERRKDSELGRVA
jgi:predicted DNA-binding transcriptional regulator AlpA